MLTTTNLIGFGGGGDVGPYYQYMERRIENTIQSSHDFTGVNFGADHPDRAIIIAVSATAGGGPLNRLSGTASDHAIGDVSAPGVTRFNFDSGNQVMVGFLTGQPTGTSGTVTVAFDNATNYCVIAVYRVIGLSTLTPADTGGTADNSTSFNCDANVTANSLVLAAGSIHVSDTVTWSGVDERTEVDNGVTKHSFADYRALSAETPRSMSMTIGASDQAVNLSAVWPFA